MSRPNNAVKDLAFTFEGAARSELGVIYYLLLWDKRICFMNLTKMPSVHYCTSETPGSNIMLFKVLPLLSDINHYPNNGGPKPRAARTMGKSNRIITVDPFSQGEYTTLVSRTCHIQLINITGISQSSRRCSTFAIDSIMLNTAIWNAVCLLMGIPEQSLALLYPVLVHLSSHLYHYTRF
jgi:hypothetical protein